MTNKRFVDVQIQEIIPIDVEIQDVDMVEIEIQTPIVISTGDIETYKGPYETVSEVSDDITLNTKDKLMKKDMTVLKIPYFETHNEEGITVFIGEHITIN